MIEAPMVRIAKLIEYVRTHLDADLNVQVLAERAGFSPFHFQRIFRVAVGDTIGEYIRKRRLQEAAIRLRSGDDAVTEVALDAGYETPSAFTRAFVSTYGETPTAFRASGRDVISEDTMEYRTERLERMRLLGMRALGPYSDVPALWERMIGHAGARGILTGCRGTVGLSYDDPDTVDLDRLRYDACIVTDADPDDALSVFVVEAGRFAIYRHLGAHALIGHAFDRFIDHLVFREGAELRNAACMELYRNNPSVTAENDLVTDLAVPIV